MVSESVWWQRLNTNFLGSNQMIVYPSSDRTNWYPAAIQWKREANGQSTLVHGLIQSNELGSTSGLFSTDPTKTLADVRNMKTRAPANGTSIIVIPRGLYVNLKQIPTSKHIRIFVLDKESVVHPIELTDAELSLFQPGVYPTQLLKTALWKKKFLPLLDPDLIERERLYDALEQEKREVADLETRGIRLERVYQPYIDGLWSASDWITHPDGSSVLQCAFYSGLPPGLLNIHKLDHEHLYYHRGVIAIPTGQHRFTMEIFRTYYEVDGKSLRTGGVHAQFRDGTIREIDLSPEEKLQFTRELVSSKEAFMASDLFKNKIASLIGPSIPVSKEE